MIISRRFFVLGSSCLILLPVSVLAAGISRKGKNKKNLNSKGSSAPTQGTSNSPSSTSNRNDNLFTRSINETIGSIQDELKKIWGEDVRLPTKKVWYGYTHQNKTRIEVDYEKGTISVESKDPNVSQSELEKILQKVINSSEKELDAFDPVKTNLGKSGKPYSPDPTARTKSGRRKMWSSNKRLSALADATKKIKHVKRKIKQKDGTIETVARVTKPMRADHTKLNAQALKNEVYLFADRYKLTRALVLSIIKNESSFNPRAHSPANAFGLMQLVPTSGGRDAYTFLLKKDSTPSPTYLYVPDQNVELGSIYLHILMSRYFGDVKNLVSRRHCVISAYNTGAGNVAKAFGAGSNPQKAVKAINKMSPQQVFNTLEKKLPFNETRVYLKRVTRDLTLFQDWDVT